MQRNLRYLSVQLLVIVLLVTILSPVDSISFPGHIPEVAAQDQGYEPQFEPSLCPVSLSYGFTVQCGFLVVPEDRNNPDGNQVRLAVAMAKSRSDNPEPDPILLIQGSLGMDAVGAGLPLIQNFYSEWLRDRDIIILDQRGSGYSQPALNCPEMEILYFERIGVNLEPEDDAAIATAAAERCLERLGVDMRFYNEEQSVLDIRDLRMALEVDEWNVLAISLATRTALSLVRDYPEGIRSVILDGTLPPDVSVAAEGIAPTANGINKLLDACATHRACSAAYPDLEQQMLDLIEKLNADPVLVPVLHPLEGTTTEYYLDGDRAIAALTALITQSDVTGRVPMLIDQLLNEEYITFLRIVSQDLNLHLFLAEGALVSANCYAEPAMPDDAEPILVAAELPEPLINAVIAGQMSPYVDGLCETWQSGAAAASYFDPVESDVPALLLSATFDTITPPEWSAAAVERLSNGVFVEVPGLGHSVLKNTCPIEIATQFIDSPTGTLDTSCLDDMPAFDFVAPSE